MTRMIDGGLLCRCSARRAFRAMGTDAEVIVVAGSAAHAEALAASAMLRIDQLEQRWSRFIPSSEVNALNEHAGTAVTVSADTVLLVELARDAFFLSGGSFDPTVLGDVLRAGYDRTFAELDPTALTYSSLLTGCDDIVVEGDRVTLPAGTGFDPGGIGKGLAADIVTSELLDAGAHGACVNLGGDVRVRGIAPNDDEHQGGDVPGWTIAVEHPASNAPIAVVGLHDGAVATSTTLKRRWTTGGVERHHLIDPGTGLPTDSDLELVTVVAHNGWVAEILAKAVLLRGSAHPFDLIDGSQAEALAVDDQGHVHASRGVARFAPARRTFVPRPATERND